MRFQPMGRSDSELVPSLSNQEDAHAPETAQPESQRCSDKKVTIFFASL